jgi:hypothetical protein
MEEKQARAKEQLYQAELRLRSIEIFYREALDYENELKKTLEEERKRAARCQQLGRALANCQARWEKRAELLKDEISKLQVLFRSAFSLFRSDRSHST